MMTFAVQIFEDAGASGAWSPALVLRTEPAQRFRPYGFDPWRDGVAQRSTTRVTRWRDRSQLHKAKRRPACPCPLVALES
jgi:hypothetical protein